MLMDVAARKFSFGFDPNFSGTFSLQNLDLGNELYLRNLCEEVRKLATGAEVWPGGDCLSSVIGDFPALFSPTLGTANCTRMKLNYLTLLLCVRKLTGVLGLNLRSLRRWLMSC
jgi:hypothetical protein